MKPSNLFKSDDRAVSPVIGVILMVAITVILAAVIGTFVLGLGDSLGDNQPTAQLDSEIVQDGSNYSLTIEHGGGDRIESSTLNVIVSDANGTEIEDAGVFGDAFTVGSSQSADFAAAGDGSEADLRVRIIHQPSDSILLDDTVRVNNGDIGSSASLSF